MIKRIIVWERSTGLQRPVGEIAWELISENGKARGAFRYLQSYNSKFLAMQQIQH